MLNQELHFLLLQAFHYSNKMMTQQTLALELYPGQPKILECLIEEDGLTPKEIGQKCVLDKSTMTTLLKKMEQQKYIYFQIKNHDKRSKRVYLTNFGKQKAREVKKICQMVDNIGYKSLDIQKTNDLLNQIINNFKEVYDE